MAGPSTDFPPSSLYLPTPDDHFSRWSSSSSLSSSSSISRSTSSTGMTDCPSMSKSFTSMSSDTQTDNETPPESPREESLKTTPVIRDATHRPIGEYPYRPALRAFPSHLSVCSSPGDDPDGPDAGYEAESEEHQTKRPVTRRTTLERTTFRRRGEPSSYRPSTGSRNRFLSGTLVANPSSPALSKLSENPSADPVCQSISLPRPRGPRSIALPEVSPPVFPKPKPSGKASIGLGLGLGLPSTLSAVRRAPNCAYRSNTDPVASPMRSLIPVTPTDLLLPADVNPFPQIPMKPRLVPVSSPAAADELSSLDLVSPLALDDAISPPGAPIQPRHASFCFSHGRDGPADFETCARRLTASAFLTIANHAQTQRPRIPSSLRGIRNGPPSRGSQLPPTCEEVCPGDGERGIRRYEAMNPYFPAMGYCVTSG